VTVDRCDAAAATTVKQLSQRPLRRGRGGQATQPEAAAVTAERCDVAAVAAICRTDRGPLW